MIRTGLNGPEYLAFSSNCVAYPLNSHYELPTMTNIWKCKDRFNDFQKR